MKNNLLRSLGLLTILALSAVGCSDAGMPTMASDDGPALSGSIPGGVINADPLFRDIGPRFAITAQTHIPNGLLTGAADSYGDDEVFAARRAKPLFADEIVTEEIEGDEGGTIELSKAGMKIIIPEDALGEDVELDITVKAYAGKYHVYEFLPHGIEFKKPIRVEFELVNIEDFAESLEERLKKFATLQTEIAECQALNGSGATLSSECQKLLASWNSLLEDVEWYVAAVDSDGFVGVYFKGDVYGDGALSALEIFNVEHDGDELSFETNHFSGYALGM